MRVSIHGLMILVVLAAMLAVFMPLCFAATVDGWTIIDASWRPDRNPWAQKQVWEGYPWTEGWGYKEQFWPKYFKASGSLHVILRNETLSPARLQLDDIDGVELGNAVTNRDQVGRIIWRNFFPREVKPGGWVECILRLRTEPTDDVKLGLTAGDRRVELTIPIKPRKARIESISFSPATDRIHIYVRGLDGSRPQAKSLRLDGVAVRPALTPGPAGSSLVLTEAKLRSPWQWGTYHLVEVVLANGTVLAYPIRAWDSYFAIGLFGDTTTERVKDAVQHGFNTYVASPMGGGLDQVGVNYIPGKPGGRIRTRTQTGTLFYYNLDEPDAHDGEGAPGLPYMDRLGFYAQTEVLARYWEEQYDVDPSTPALLLVDGTYKPAQWYVYGQCCDVFATDPYVPLGGDQLDYVAHALEVARDGGAPNPPIATIWAINEDVPAKRPRDRAPTPQEERMMVFYALGAGSKGLLYFADRDGRSGEPTGVSHNQPVWAEIGKINADVKVLAPYLARSCPAGVPVEDEQVWVRHLMSGANAMVTIVVNKGHFIDYSTPTGIVTHRAAKNVSVSVPLPAHLRKVLVREVRQGKLVPVASRLRSGRVLIRLDQVDTTRVFVITAIGK